MAIALSSPTLGRMLSNVRDMLNQPNASNSTWTDAFLTEQINKGVQRYFAEVVQNVEGHFVTTTTLNIVSGSETIALPTGCFEVKGLWKVVSDGRVILNYRNNLNTGVITQGFGGSGETWFPDYSFRGNNLAFNPVPDFSETGGLFLEYIEFPERMLNAGDTLSQQIAPVFSDLIEMYAVYRAKMQESLVSGVDTSALAKAELASLYAQFTNSIRNRSKNPQFVQPFSP